MVILDILVNIFDCEIFVLRFRGKFYFNEFKYIRFERMFIEI